jgi:small subunit ribosomal protein S17
MPNNRRRLTGHVVSAAMQKTIVVSVSTSKRHPVYGKVLRTSKRYLVHDEHGQAKLGDRVRIVESRPLSRRKRWALESVLRAHNQPAVAQDTEVKEEVT